MMQFEQFLNRCADGLVLICQNLHVKDVFNLELVSRQLRSTILKIVWPTINVLIFHSIERPLTQLSLTRMHHYIDDTLEDHRFRMNNDKIDFLLQRCGQFLSELDLDGSRWFIRRNWRLLHHPKTTIMTTNHMESSAIFETSSAANAMRPLHIFQQKTNENDAEEAESSSSAALLVRSLCMHCSSIHKLDLSFIPISGQLLVQLGTSLGHSLRVVRFVRSLTEFSCNQQRQISNCEIGVGREHPLAKFFASTQRLQKLDISENFFDGTPSFTELSSTLQSLKLWDTQINVSQVLQALRRTSNLRELHCNVNKRLFPSQQQMDAFFITLPISIEVLWLGSPWTLYDWFDPADIEFAVDDLTQPPEPPSGTIRHRIVLHEGLCSNLRRIRLAWEHDPADIYIGSLRLSRCEFAKSSRVGLLPKLEELYISRGQSIAAHFLHFSYLGNMQNLTRLYISFQYCTHFNDLLLEKVAPKMRGLQELRLLFCKNVTWKGFATFINNCPMLQVIEGAEQLTDELLDHVMTKLDVRLNEQGWRNGPSAVLPPAAVFCFIRVQLDFLFDDNLNYFENRYCNGQQVQSRSQNLHPALIYREAKPKDPITTGQLISWPTLATSMAN